MTIADNDLAILVLRTDLKWTRWVSAICLPKWNHKLPDSGTVVGWGSTKPRTYSNRTDLTAERKTGGCGGLGAQ